MEFLSSFYKNSTAIITENNEYISYQKLYEYVDKFSNIIKKRYLVFLVCKNNLESIVGYLSFIKSDCVISLIDEKISEKYFNKLIKDYRPEYIFFEKNRIKKLDNLTSIYNFYSYELLKSKKISVKVVNMHTIKPLDKKVIEEACNSKLIVSVEEHNIIGGLGSAIAEYKSCLNKSPRQLFLGVKDTYSKGGNYRFLLEKHRLNSEKIVEDILNNIN